MTANPNYLRNIELDAQKIRNKDLHRLADVIELSCLKNPDQEITIAEALDEQLGGNEGVGGIVQTDPPADEDAEEGRVEEDLEDDIGAPAARNDRRANLLRDIQENIQARAQLFGDNYPFLIEDDSIQIKPNPTENHKLYIFMLFAANLCFFPKPDAYKLTADFEIAAAFALKRFFPSWIIKIFGTADSEHMHSYTGTPKQKIVNFARDLKLKLGIEEEELDRMHTPNGDAGLDVVAWHPFDDGAGHMPVFLAQVGCTANEDQMFEKQYSVDTRLWSARLRGLAAIGCMVTPQCYRDSHNSWPCFTRVQSVFIDRARVLSLLTAAEDFQFDYLQTHQVVESTVS